MANTVEYADAAHCDPVVGKGLGEDAYTLTLQGGGAELEIAGSLAELEALAGTILRLMQAMRVQDGGRR